MSETKDILKKPYTRGLVPQEDGTFFAYIIEFPGCSATGGSVQEAYDELERIAVGWIDACLDLGHALPEPKH